MADPWEMQWSQPEGEQDAPWEATYAQPEAQQSGPWEMEWSGAVNVVDRTFQGLAAREGTGDKVTSVRTGALGVTKAARDAVGDDGKLPDADVARLYLTRLNMRWEKQEGYQQAPPELQEALLDASYNMGEKVFKFKDLNEALKKGDYEGAARELLDTASVDDKTVKGLAKRRAELYNVVAQDDITEVEQLKDGTIIYRSGDNEVLRYKAKGGKHEKSNSGVISVGDGRL